MKNILSISQFIVDASRLDLSSPAQGIHTTGLMNQTPTIEFISRRGAISIAVVHEAASLARRRKKTFINGLRSI
jgi:hypothetical protein